MKITPRPAVIGLLSIIALSLAAATLTSPVAVDGDVGFGGDSGIGEPTSGDESIGIPLDTSDQEGTGGTLIDICVEPLADISPAVLLLGFVLVGGSLSYALGGLGAAFAVVTIGVWTLVIAILFLTAGCPTGGMEPETVLPGDAETTLEGEGLIGDEAGDGAQSVPVPSLVLLVAVAIGVVGVLLGLRNNDSVSEENDSTTEPVSNTNSVARQPQGSVTTEVSRQDLPPENTIYQAWTAFTTSLDVTQPQATTPAEYATIALDAGYDKRAVRELTGIFQAVRYGVVEPTPERSDTALTALRTIEESVDNETLSERTAQLADNE